MLYPAREPRPALKYQLLPPLLERRPGNAALHYLKVPHEQTHLFADAAFWDDDAATGLKCPCPSCGRQPAGRGSNMLGSPNPSGIFDIARARRPLRVVRLGPPRSRKRSLHDPPARGSDRTANRPGFWRPGRGCRSPTAGTTRPSERCGPVMPLGGTWLRPPRSSTAWLAPPLPVACRSKWRRSSSSPMPPISTGPWPRCRGRWSIFVRALKGKWWGSWGFTSTFPISATWTRRATRPNTGDNSCNRPSTK